MKYYQPFDQPSAPNASYVNGNPSSGVLGSIIPAEAVEFPQREILNAITGAGLTPSASDNTQLWQAMQAAGSGAAIYRNFKTTSSATTSSSVTLTSAAVGTFVFLNNNANQTVTLPNPSGLPVGATITVAKGGSGNGIVSSFGGASNIDTSVGVLSSISMNVGEYAELTWSGTAWIALGTFMARYAGPQAQQNTGASGYQRFSGGMLFQWGQATFPVGTNTLTVTLPVAWSIGLRGAASTDSGANVFSYSVYPNTANPLTQITLNAPNYWINQTSGGVIVRPAPPAGIYWSCWGF